MARVGLSITKSCTFRNATQEFSNVYYFNGGVSLPSTSDADSLIDAVKSFEAGIHAGNVTFVRGRIWSDTGSKATNEMITQKLLSGTGSLGSLVYDKERAFLFRLRAGNDSRGQPVYLRKWYHTGGNGPGNVAVQTNVMGNTTGFTSTERNNMASAVNTCQQFIIGGIPYSLCAKGGRVPGIGENFVCHPFFEHHQMGDQWRSQ